MRSSSTYSGRWRSYCSLVQRIGGQAWLREFGRISYFLYLVHFPLRVVLEEPFFFKPREYRFTRGTASIVAPVTTVAVALCGVAVSFRYFEMPLLRLKRFFPSSALHPMQADVPSTRGPA